MWPYTDEEYEQMLGDQRPALTYEGNFGESKSDKDEAAEKVYIWLKEFRAGVMDP